MRSPGFTTEPEQTQSSSARTAACLPWDSILGSTADAKSGCGRVAAHSIQRIQLALILTVASDASAGARTGFENLEQVNLYDKSSHGRNQAACEARDSPRNIYVTGGDG
jgi:hypothetical protein